MAYNATVLADSVGPHGGRLTTLEVTFPRPYLAEFNTHRVFSRNSESSRAIPTEILIERVLNDPYIPEFRERVKGMGGGKPLLGVYRERATAEWLRARDAAVETARQLLKVAKDDANRVLEPFLWQTVIVTSTEWENFFNLRIDEAAAIPMQRIATLMQNVMFESIPKHVGYGGWHLPLVSQLEYDLADLGAERTFTNGAKAPYAAFVSAGRCARSSYSNHHQPETANQSINRWDNLVRAGHWSPGEHTAQCVRAVGRDFDNGNFRVGWTQLRKFYPQEAVFTSV